MPFTPRSQGARDAVLAAARRAFADRGYERATLRSIAADAGVDASMVIRYYGSKDALFEAATAVDLALPDLTRVDPSARGTTLAARFVALWDDPTTGEVLTLLLRAAPTSPRAAARIRDVFAGQVVDLVRRLDGGASAASEPGDDPVAARAAALGSFILGSALARYVLALPPLAGASPAEVVDVMAPVLDTILGTSSDGPLPGRA